MPKLMLEAANRSPASRQTCLPRSPGSNTLSFRSQHKSLTNFHTSCSARQLRQRSAALPAPRPAPQQTASSTHSTAGRQTSLTHVRMQSRQLLLLHHPPLRGMSTTPSFCPGKTNTGWTS